MKILASSRKHESVVSGYMACSIRGCNEYK